MPRDRYLSDIGLDGSPRSSTASASTPRSSSMLLAATLSQLSSPLKSRLSRAAHGKRSMSPERPTRKLKREGTTEVKRGVITVRRAEVFKLWTKGDSYIEISIDDILIGRTPNINWYDRYPSLEHTMRMQDFKAGDDLKVAIIGKGSWPKKDAEVATGTLHLSEDIFLRRAVEEDVDIFLPAMGSAPPQRYGDEHMASVRLNIEFEMKAKVATADDGQAATRTRSQRPSQTDSAFTSANSLSSRAAGIRPSHIINGHGLREDDEDYGNENDQWYPVHTQPVLTRDRGVYIPDTLRAARQQLVEQQYFGREPRGPHAVLWTPMVSKLLRSYIKSIGCLPSWPTAEEDDEFVDY